MNRAYELISALFESELDTDLHDRIRGWLFTIPNNGTAEVAFARWAALNIEPECTAPDSQTTEGFRRLASLLGFEHTTLPVEIRRAAMPLHRVVFRAAAAVLIPILIAGGAALFLLDGERSAPTAEDTVLAMAAGESRTFSLPDGSTVALEENSTLVYNDDFAINREVELDGEAFFIVAHDATHPFSVRHDEMRVNAIGTEFYVRTGGESGVAEVILTRGRVAVEAGSRRIELAPGEKASVNKSNGYAVELTEAGRGEIMRVSHGEFSIENVSSRAAIVIAADYFGMPLVIEPDTPAGNHINLIAPARMSIDEVLASINSVSDSVQARLEGDTIIASKK